MNPNWNEEDKIEEMMGRDACPRCLLIVREKFASKPKGAKVRL
jgi:hypothetical protein